MAKPISIQLYTLREQVKTSSFADVLKVVADTGYAGVEFAGLHGLSAKEVRKILDDLGLMASSAHVPVFKLENAEQIIADAKELGYTDIGSGFGPPQFESEDAVKAIAEQINAAIDLYEKAGLKVSYHNHWWEFPADKKLGLLMKLCPRLQAQLDIYWVQTGGSIPAQVIRDYKGRIRTIHVKDGPCEKDKAMTAVGSGRVDIPAALMAAEEAGVNWFIVELDRCDTDMVVAVRESYKYLVGNKFASGRK